MIFICSIHFFDINPKCLSTSRFVDRITHIAHNQLPEQDEESSSPQDSISFLQSCEAFIFSPNKELLLDLASFGDKIRNLDDCYVETLIDSPFFEEFIDVILTIEEEKHIYATALLIYQFSLFPTDVCMYMLQNNCNLFLNRHIYSPNPDIQMLIVKSALHFAKDSKECCSLLYMPIFISSIATIITQNPNTDLSKSCVKLLYQFCAYEFELIDIPIIRKVYNFLFPSQDLMHSSLFLLYLAKCTHEACLDFVEDSFLNLLFSIVLEAQSRKKETIILLKHFMIRCGYPEEAGILFHKGLLEILQNLIQSDSKDIIISVLYVLDTFIQYDEVFDSFIQIDIFLNNIGDFLLDGDFEIKSQASVVITRIVEKRAYFDFVFNQDIQSLIEHSLSCLGSGSEIVIKRLLNMIRIVLNLEEINNQTIFSQFIVNNYLEEIQRFSESDDIEVQALANILLDSFGKE